MAASAQAISTSQANAEERRLEQAQRMAKEPVDPLTKERLERLISDLEEQLR
jgi:hypothetical protein